MRRSRASGVAKLTGVELIAARFFIEEAFFDVEAQAVLAQCLSIGGLTTYHEPGIIRLVKQTGESQVDWPNGCSEKCHVLNESALSSSWAEIFDGRDRLARQMDQGVALQPQTKVPLLLAEIVQQWLMHEAVLTVNRNGGAAIEHGG